MLLIRNVFRNVFHISESFLISYVFINFITYFYMKDTFLPRQGIVIINQGLNSNVLKIPGFNKDNNS